MAGYYLDCYQLRKKNKTLEILQKNWDKLRGIRKKRELTSSAGVANLKKEKRWRILKILAKDMKTTKQLPLSKHHKENLRT